MTVLLVGADRLGSIPEELQEFGFKRIIHWDGRKAKLRNKSLPLNIDMVLVFSDYINHGLMYSIKKEAKEKLIPIIFSKRARSCLNKALMEGGYSQADCSNCPIQCNKY